MQPYCERMSKPVSVQLLIIRTYPGLKGESELYEDDGRTDEYLKGCYALTKFSYHRVGNHVTLTIFPTQGNYYTGQVQTRSYFVEFPNTSSPRNGRINGQVCNLTYDPSTLTSRIVIPHCSIREEVKVEMEMEEIDPRQLADQAITRRMNGIVEATPKSFLDASTPPSALSTKTQRL